jgi:hypothetical protein
MTTARHIRAYLGTAIPVLLLVVAVMGLVAWCPSVVMASTKATCVDRGCAPITMRGVQAQEQEPAVQTARADASLAGAPVLVPAQWAVAALPGIVGAAPERPGDPLFGRLLI